MSRRGAWTTAVLVYLAYIVVVLSPVWTSGIEPNWDGRDFNYPAFSYAAEALLDGRLPLWDPLGACGQPFISDPAYLRYQPGAILASFVRSSHLDSYMLFWSVTWAWSGLGAFLLAAVLGAGPGGCVAAAIMYSLSGFFVGHGQHVPFLVTAAWFPWVLAFAHRAVARVSWADTLLAGAALGLSALGGYAGLVIFEGIALVLWLGLAFLWPRSAPAAEHSLPLRSRSLWIATVLATSAGLLAAIWSPSLWAFLIEAADFTDRTRPVTDELALSGNPFPLVASVTFLFPRLTIDLCQAHPSACLGSDISMVNAYAGALAVPLAAVFLAHDGRRTWWIGLFVVFWFWVSLGAGGGLRTILHYLVPATAFMRHNAMLRALYLAPLAAAAGVGLTRATASARPLAVRVMGGAVIVTVVAAAISARAFDARGGDAARWALSAILPLTLATMALWVFRRDGRVAILAVVGLIGLDLAWHFHSNAYTVGTVSE